MIKARSIRPVSKFIHLEYTSGMVLFLAVVLAIIWVNSPFADAYHHKLKFHA
ncbi:Na+/H+ antiporter NhaA [Mucilaginibacter sp. SG538B]|uniref:Na+/H+ antiporter NhaA n=2 Tax=unclassified Mucilaginibacter TaxID=2617802 RepID=UPI0021021C3D|nr:Na+/H+ antiporter NhaA [Mucilaginibacter sp. SG538B]